MVWLYALPVDPRFPVVCCDERPCFRIGHTVPALALKAGSVVNEHSEYAKLGSCVLLAAIEPKTDTRVVRVEAHRRKREYVLFLRALAAPDPLAAQIRLVQENLNTHDLRALYETFPAAEALALSQWFAFYQTPKKASWLNMVEIELSAIARQCLGALPRKRSLSAKSWRLQENVKLKPSRLTGSVPLRQRAPNSIDTTKQCTQRTSCIDKLELHSA